MIELSEKNATLNAENIYYANKDTISQLTTDIARKSESEKNVSAYTEQINRILSETSELKTKKETLQKDISECSEHILKYNFEIETLSHKIIKDGDKCRECGEIIYKKDKPQLFIDSDKAEKDTETINIKVHELSDTKSSKENGLKDIISKAEKLNDSYHDVKSKLEHEKETVETFSKNIESHSELVPLCGYTPVGKDVLDKAIKELTEEKNTIDAELKKPGTYDIQGIDNKIKSVSENITNIEDDKTKLLIQSGQLISQLSLNEKLSSENLVNVSNMDNEKKENEDWCVICTALSNEGIQSMELKAAVPEIMDTTNTILEKVYGDKFTVRISTDKEGAKKTVTDFTIMVINNENGWEMPLKMVSTGERVWIEQALFYAFSITGTSESGSGFSVRFLDEKDGSLDSELRGRYVEMINASHIAGNAYQTVLITHSQEIKDSVKQVINF
jgi:DNA repair exonuclease SbcCD ATPase subunit